MASPSRLACGCVAVVAVAACYPEFSFLDPGGNGGSGAGDGPSSSARVAVGVGGGGSSMQASTSSNMPGSTSSTGNQQSSATTTTGSAMPVVPQVSCGPPQFVGGEWDLSPCEPGQVCCFHKVTPAGDNCSGSCDPDDFYTFTCDGPQDCEAGYMCCANVSGNTVTSTGCVLGCVAPNIVLCETTADCPSGTCQIAFSDAGYDEEYLGCQ